jgi:hypothetical protein
MYLQVIISNDFLPLKNDENVHSKGNDQDPYQNVGSTHWWKDIQKHGYVPVKTDISW